MLPVAEGPVANVGEWRETDEHDTNGAIFWRFICSNFSLWTHEWTRRTGIHVYTCMGGRTRVSVTWQGLGDLLRAIR